MFRVKIQKLKTLLKYRLKLSWKLYKRRIIIVSAITTLVGISNWTKNGDPVMLLTIFLLWLFLMSIFLFPDYHAPTNNPVRKYVKNFKETDKEYGKWDKAIARDKRIDQILK